MPNAPFDALKPFSFNGFDFPYTDYTVTGGIRKHNHEYPHNPGAAVEKLNDIVMVRRSFYDRFDPGDDFRTEPFLGPIPEPTPPGPLAPLLLGFSLLPRLGKGAKYRPSRANAT